MLNTSQAFRRSMAERTAPVMFCLSLLWLATVATVIVLWVDVPRMSSGDEETGAATTGAEQAPGEELLAEGLLFERRAVQLGGYFVLLLGVLWLLFILEFVIQYLAHERGTPFWGRRYGGLFICLCPPLRLCARNPDMEEQIWLPGLRWRDADDDLRSQLERTFSIPMILIALMILPVLLVEILLRDQVEAHTWLRVVLHVSTGLIWFAFAAEFIVMFSVAQKKFRYCQQHWLDLAIIVLPLISFLRSLRIVRATRVAQLAKIQQLSKMSRIYRLRGLTEKAFRALLLLELLNQIFRVPPEKRLERLQERLQEMETEMKAVRNEIAELEQAISERQQAEMAEEEMPQQDLQPGRSEPE